MGRAARCRRLAVLPVPDFEIEEAEYSELESCPLLMSRPKRRAALVAARGLPTNGFGFDI